MAVIKINNLYLNDKNSNDNDKPEILKKEIQISETDLKQFHILNDEIILFFNNNSTSINNIFFDCNHRSEHRNQTFVIHQLYHLVNHKVSNSILKPEKRNIFLQSCFEKYNSNMSIVNAKTLEGYDHNYFKSLKSNTYKLASSIFIYEVLVLSNPKHYFFTENINVNNLFVEKLKEIIAFSKLEYIKEIGDKNYKQKKISHNVYADINSFFDLDRKEILEEVFPEIVDNFYNSFTILDNIEFYYLITSYVNITKEYYKDNKNDHPFFINEDKELKNKLPAKIKNYLSRPFFEIPDINTENISLCKQIKFFDNNCFKNNVENLIIKTIFFNPEMKFFLLCNTTGKLHKLNIKKNILFAQQLDNPFIDEKGNLIKIYYSSNLKSGITTSIFNYKQEEIFNLGKNKFIKYNNTIPIKNFFVNKIIKKNNEKKTLNLLNNINSHLVINSLETNEYSLVLKLDENVIIKNSFKNPNIGYYFQSQSKINPIVSSFYKYLTKLFPNINQDGITNYVEIHENFVLKLYTKENPFENISMVKGNDILTSYNYRNAVSSGPIGGSCMRHDNTKNRVSYYTKLENCNLLILKNGDDNKITTRALIWKDISGKLYHDRIFYDSETNLNLFKSYLKENNIDTINEFVKVKVDIETHFQQIYTYTLPYFDNMSMYDLITETLSKYQSNLCFSISNTGDLDGDCKTYSTEEKSKIIQFYLKYFSISEFINLFQRYEYIISKYFIIQIYTDFNAKIRNNKFKINKNCCDVCKKVLEIDDIVLTTEKKLLCKEHGILYKGYENKIQDVIFHNLKDFNILGLKITENTIIDEKGAYEEINYPDIVITEGKKINIGKKVFDVYNILNYKVGEETKSICFLDQDKNYMFKYKKLFMINNEIFYKDDETIKSHLEVLELKKILKKMKTINNDKKK